jgi:hypothetical protein
VQHQASKLAGTQLQNQKHSWESHTCNMVKEKSHAPTHARNQQFRMLTVVSLSCALLRDLNIWRWPHAVIVLLERDNREVLKAEAGVPNCRGKGRCCGQIRKREGREHSSPDHCPSTTLDVHAYRSAARTASHACCIGRSWVDVRNRPPSPPRAWLCRHLHRFQQPFEPSCRCPALHAHANILAQGRGGSVLRSREGRRRRWQGIGGRGVAVAWS